jgi:hypothetical protein
MEMTLTDRQLAVLRWINDGCPDNVMSGEAHKVSAAALRAAGSCPAARLARIVPVRRSGRKYEVVCLDEEAILNHALTQSRRRYRT